MRYFEGLTGDEAKAEYKRLCFQLHPDQSGRDSSAEFIEMRAQFEKYRPSKFNRSTDTAENWDATAYADIIDQLLDIAVKHDIEIEINGCFIWIGGDTKPAKDLIKAVDVGAYMNPPRFARKKSLWYFSPAGYQRRGGRSFTHDQIRAAYGSQVVDTNRRAPAAQTSLF